MHVTAFYDHHTDTCQIRDSKTGNVMSKLTLAPATLAKLKQMAPAIKENNIHSVCLEKAVVEVSELEVYMGPIAPDGVMPVRGAPPQRKKRASST